MREDELLFLKWGWTKIEERKNTRNEPPVFKMGSIRNFENCIKF